ncbi:hypothetical protein HY745_03060 [Candidatus Desantisbacteria bacterium]|nr:hypothetical protein [Candidatus Desantisbacteria bacterium]
MTYDNMGRLQRMTDPNNTTSSYTYNIQGWLETITLGNKTWQKTYDDEGIITSDILPSGKTTTYQSNNLGLLKSVTNPLNQTTTSITDLKGSIWTFGYTDMGKLKSTTDPLGNTLQRNYDTRGRLKSITFPDGSIENLTYDNASNLIRRQYTDGTDLQYTCDASNRLITANEITLTRDAEDKITVTDNSGTIFGATYDDGGRLMRASYNNDAFIITYTYDSTTGLLSGITDSLTNTSINFTYNLDNKLTDITRSNSVNTSFIYDSAGRITQIKDGNIIDLQYTLDAVGKVIGLDMTAPIDPADLLQDKTDSFIYDSASQIRIPGYSYDKQGRMTTSPEYTFSWDGASRLTGIGETALAYNGLGDLVTRTEGGVSTHFYYNKAIKYSPIIAEKKDNIFLRYYVWKPDGQLLYMIDAADGNKVYFYHFDRIGSTLALTNSSGSVTDSYAYTPYGKILKHNGSNAQPFTFIGTWGTRMESATGDIYHMRARYYDAVTGRFLSRETCWPVISNPMNINTYQYALQNPQKFIDPTGWSPTESFDQRSGGTEIYQNFGGNSDITGDREMVGKFGNTGKGPKARDEAQEREERIKDAVKDIIIDELKGRVEDKLTDEAIEKLKDKLAGKILKAAVSKANVAGTLIEGASSIKTLTEWATAEEGKAAEAMSKELSYAVTQYAEENSDIAKSIIRSIGSIISFFSD